MGSGDFIDLHAPSGPGSGGENNELQNSNSESSEADFQPSNSEIKEDVLNRENLGQFESDGGNEDGQLMQGADIDKGLVDKLPILRKSVDLTETVTMAEKMNCFNSDVHTQNGFPLAQKESSISKHKIDGSPISGVKRARMTYEYDDQQPLVHVKYNSLTRDSKRKLEELLLQWSEWHAKLASSSNDSSEVLESGEGSYFPALHVGSDKSSTVSFWMDNQARKQQSKGFIPLDGDSVPLYDRGYALVLNSMDGSTNLERGLDTMEASRCFNCGSYNHSLKECPKPRDNVAVNNARKQHMSKRNQTAGPRNSTRYYQNSPCGKYDGLRPGALGAETRQLLGLGELDPPPWLNRMREIGYPPGYRALEDEDQPSGITIFADEETKEEQDGEILETDNPEQQKKMSVEFPGINAPIPENADQRCWAESQRGSSFDPSRNRLYHRSNRSSEVISNGHNRDQMWSRDYRDDGSPGCNPGVNPSMPAYSQRYSGYDLNYTSEFHSPRGNIPIPRSPGLGRSLSDRGRWSPLVHEGSPSHSPYSSLPYSSPNTGFHLGQF